MTAIWPSVRQSAIEGVAFLRMRDSQPVEVAADRRGRPCDGAEECATGAVYAVSLAPSCAEGAVAIYNLTDVAEPQRIMRKQRRRALRFQWVRGSLDVVPIDFDADDADDLGRGESPWDEMAELPEDTAIELLPRLDGIRELRLRHAAIDRLELGPVKTYRPAGHVHEIAAAAQRLRARRGAG